MIFNKLFPKSTRVHTLAHGSYEIRYYLREGKPFRRRRLKGFESWADTEETQVAMSEYKAAVDYLDAMRKAHRTLRS